MSTSEWDAEKIRDHFEMPFFELIHLAYLCLKTNFDSGDMELCTLSNIKTGGCPEDCAYCPQSAHYKGKTGVKNQRILDVELVISQAKQAKMSGAKRLCMGAAWRNPPKAEFPKVLSMIAGIKKLGLETCATLGMLDEEQAIQLKAAGLDYYNHNLDTARAFYPKIISTRNYQDCLDTLQKVADAGIEICCGGILGLGESFED